MSKLLKMEGIGKSFGQVRALNNVSLELDGIDARNFGMN